MNKFEITGVIDTISALQMVPSTGAKYIEFTINHQTPKTSRIQKFHCIAWDKTALSLTFANPGMKMLLKGYIYQDTRHLNMMLKVKTFEVDKGYETIKRQYPQFPPCAPFQSPPFTQFQYSPPNRTTMEYTPPLKDLYIYSPSSAPTNRKKIELNLNPEEYKTMVNLLKAMNINVG